MAKVSCVRCGFIYDSSETKNCPECGIRAPLAYTHCGKPGKKNKPLATTEEKPKQEIEKTSSVTSEPVTDIKQKSQQTKIKSASATNAVAQESGVKTEDTSLPSFEADIEETSSYDIDDMISQEMDNVSEEPTFDTSAYDGTEPITNNEPLPPEIDIKETQSNIDQNVCEKEFEPVIEEPTREQHEQEPLEEQKNEIHAHKEKVDSSSVTVATENLPDTQSSWLKKVLAIPETMKLEKAVSETDFNGDGYYDDVEAYDNYDAEIIAKSTILKIIGWALLGLVFVYALLYNAA